jgi:hypothetical protein
MFREGLGKLLVVEKWLEGPQGGKKHCSGEWYWNATADHTYMASLALVVSQWLKTHHIP